LSDLFYSLLPESAAIKLIAKQLGISDKE